MAVNATQIGIIYEPKSKYPRAAFAYKEATGHTRYRDSNNTIMSVKDIQRDMSNEDLEGTLKKRYSTLQAYYTVTDIDSSVRLLMAADARTMAAAITHGYVRGWAGELPQTLQPNIPWAAKRAGILDQYVDKIRAFRLVANHDAWHRRMPLLCRAMKYGIGMYTGLVVKKCMSLVLMRHSSVSRGPQAHEQELQYIPFAVHPLVWPNCSSGRLGRRRQDSYAARRAGQRWWLPPSLEFHSGFSRRPDQGAEDSLSNSSHFRG